MTIDRKSRLARGRIKVEKPKLTAGQKAAATKRKRRSKSGKGDLIKGMSRRLPVEILDSEIFKTRIKEIMRGYAGVYALYQKGDLYYVGLTTNLLGRVKGHLKDRHRDKWDHFTIFRIQKVRYLKDIETLMHNLVDAPGNRVKGKVPRDGDINRLLRVVLSEHEHTLRDLKRALRR